MKRVIAISDLHAGHAVGLTPPAWRSPKASHPVLSAVQREMWGFYERTLAALQPIDALLVLGDCVDGKGHRSGGTEQITTDMREQRRIAAACIREAKAPKIVMVYGTPYHVGPEGEDYELDLAEDVGAVIGGHEWAECHGVVFDLKHKVGGSQVPHGRHTAIARERLWNVMWHERELAPKANVILRGHVHYFNYCGGADWLGITMPAAADCTSTSSGMNASMVPVSLNVTSVTRSTSTQVLYAGVTDQNFMFDWKFVALESRTAVVRMQLRNLGTGVITAHLKRLFASVKRL